MPELERLPSTLKKAAANGFGSPTMERAWRLKTLGHVWPSRHEQIVRARRSVCDQDAWFPRRGASLDCVDLSPDFGNANRSVRRHGYRNRRGPDRLRA